MTLGLLRVAASGGAQVLSASQLSSLWECTAQDRYASTQGPRPVASRGLPGFTVSSDRHDLSGLPALEKVKRSGKNSSGVETHGVSLNLLLNCSFRSAHTSAFCGTGIQKDALARARIALPARISPAHLFSRFLISGYVYGRAGDRIDDARGSRSLPGWPQCTGCPAMR